LCRPDSSKPIAPFSAIDSLRESRFNLTFRDTQDRRGKKIGPVVEVKVQPKLLPTRSVKIQSPHPQTVGLDALDPRNLSRDPLVHPSAELD
jgi:hypothetical protein